ncbi:Zinc finger protein 771 [Frankliniella fusca]|uniref:Zinc finger protein 771 n=1 Tax=Frankliniella fusca TaxID=407009 RepID=A0AAE1I5X7_9NEOP|nr:Zinc finger protein 771 [Frankliniella fusca]
METSRGTMRNMKPQDPTVLGLGLELELKLEDVDAAVAAVAAASDGQIPCSCCDELLENADQLHSHQMVQHTLSELSLALITLRGLDLSLINNAYEVNISAEEDSSQMRNILLESVDRHNDCDSESTVTVNSEARMPIVSPPSSPVFVTPDERTPSGSGLMWGDATTSPNYTTQFIDSDLTTGNQGVQKSNDSGVWSDEKPNNNSEIKPVVVGKKKSAKSVEEQYTRQFICHLCDRRYKKKSHLERHFRVHTGVRPFGCPMCEKRFAVRSILKQHIRVHTGERPFSCNICFQRFPQKSGLMTHMMLHNGKPFKCEYCVKSFVSNHKLMIHQRSHGDLLNGAPHQGPYCCSICDMRFFTTGALSQHRKIHSPSVNKVSYRKGNVRDEFTITEEAARAAVAAVDSIIDDPLAMSDIPEIPQFDDGLPEYEDFQNSSDLLEVVKNEIFEDDDEDSASQSLFCEARWGGFEDMCISSDFSNVC